MRNIGSTSSPSPGSLVVPVSPIGGTTRNKTSEVVDFKIALDAVRSVWKDKIPVAVASDDRDYAELVFRELRDAGLPLVAITAASNQSLFREAGATEIYDWEAVKLHASGGAETTGVESRLRVYLDLSRAEITSDDVEEHTGSSTAGAVRPESGRGHQEPHSGEARQDELVSHPRPRAVLTRDLLTRAGILGGPSSPAPRMQLPIFEILPAHSPDRSPDQKYDTAHLRWTLVRLGVLGMRDQAAHDPT